MVYEQCPLATSLRTRLGELSCTAMGDFIAHNSRLRIALLILVSIAFVALGFWMIGAFGPVPSSKRYSPTMVWGIGWICVLFFSLCAIAWVRRLLGDTEQLWIGAAGVHCHAWSDKLIPWAEITNVTTWSYKRQKFLILHLRDPSLFPGRGIRAALASANRRLAGGDIHISMTGTDRSCDDAISAVRLFKT